MMKYNMIRRIGALALSLTLSLALPVAAEGGDAAQPAPTVPVAQVYLTGQTVVRLEGVKATRQLTATIEPDDATDRTLTWKSIDGTVATVDQTGKVTAVAPGETQIWVSAASGVQASSTVTVSGVRLVEAGGDRNSPALTSIALLTGKSENLSYATFGAATEAGGAAFWESSDNAVAYVSGGRINGRSPGTATVTLTVGSYSAACKVTVKENTAGVITGKASAGVPFDLSDLHSSLNTQSQSATGSPLHYVTGLSVPTSQGVLYYGYLSPEDTGYGVGGSEKYYYSDTVVDERNLSGVTFVPNADFNGSAVISYTGYGSSNVSFTGSIRLEVEGIKDVSYATTEGSPVTFQAIDFTNICRTHTGRDLSYVTFTLPPDNQGTLLYGYRASSPYVEKVSGDTGYYRTRAPYLDEISFLPAPGYTGTVRMSYRGVDTAGNGYSGRVSITVTGKNSMGTGEVRYKAGQGERVSFQLTDFNNACREAIGETLDYIRFTLPSESLGTLYYNYKSNGTYDSKVGENNRYYRSGTPSLSNVTFRPASGTLDTVRIAFTAYGMEGGRFSGTVVIQYPAASVGKEIRYSVPSGKAVEFDAADFNELCREVSGASLDYVRFDSLPATVQGTLYYNYSSSGSVGSKVSSSTRYYRSGTPALSRISFLSQRGYTGTVTLGFVGYDVDGYRFDGIVRVEVGESIEEPRVRYSVYSAGAVLFDAADFNSACWSATGESLNYVNFELPASSRGTLYYQYNQDRGTYTGKVSASTGYYRSGGSRLLDDVTFVAAGSYTGLVEIPFAGVSAAGEKFSGTVEIQVTTPVAEPLRYTGEIRPVALSAVDFRRVCGKVLGGELSYVQFTSLPPSSAGRLYLGYNGYGTGTQVTTSTRCYDGGAPGLDQLSFVPGAGFQGVLSLSYAGVDTRGERVLGTVEFTITPVTNSRFTDMTSYTWAIPSVEFLAQNGVITGVSGVQFGPGLPIRRCDFVLMLCRAFGFDTGSTTSFIDVPAGSYYARAVASAKDLGIIVGNEGKFMPDDVLTRQDAMLMLKRALTAAGWSVPNGDSFPLSGYPDNGEIADYARSSVAAMVQLGIVSGDNARRLNPRGTVTRAEVAVILHRVMTL